MVTVAENPKLIAEWDWEKNQEIGLNPQKLSEGSNKRAWWVCRKGHKWDAVIASRKNGRDCPYCSGRRAIPGENDLVTLFPDICKEWAEEENKANGVFADHITAYSKQEVWWKCSKGHLYKMTVDKKTARKFGCPYCSGYRFKSGYNDLQTIYPELAKEWHPTKNKEAKPSDIFANSREKYWWRCPLGHEYQATPRDRGVGRTNCPICNKRRQTSFPEQALFYYIKQIYPDAQNSFRDLFENGMELDIFIPSVGYGIEYDGKAFHSTDKQYQREVKKMQICHENGIKLIRIKEGEDRLERPGTADFTFYIKNPKKEEEIQSIFQHIINRFDPESSMWTRKNPWQVSSRTRVNLTRDGAKIRANYLTDIPNSLDKERPDVVRMWNFEKNVGINPRMFTTHSNTVVWWRCQICGHEWQTSINGMTRPGHIGCAICAKRIRGETQTKNALAQRSLAVACPKEILEEFNYEKNEFGPDQYTIGAGESIWWKCKVCGCEWQTTPRNRIHTHTGCPHCSGRVPLAGVDDLATVHPEILVDWDYSKNKSSPENYLPGSGKKVAWKCHVCGYERELAVREKVKGRKCPNCGCKIEVK